MIEEADRDYLNDMLRYAAHAVDLLGDRKAGALSSDPRTLFAVCYALLAVGEAANRVSTAARDQIADVPWRNVIDMRHHLAHGYDSIRLEIVVGTIRQDLPVLMSALQSALQEARP